MSNDDSQNPNAGQECATPQRWVPVRVADQREMGWLSADSEDACWVKLRRALSACLPCTKEDAQRRGYTVRLVEAALLVGDAQ